MIPPESSRTHLYFKSDDLSIHRYAYRNTCAFVVSAVAQSRYSNAQTSARFSYPFHVLVSDLVKLRL